MAGDHKCPVCSSTFTRPQHVARHMRSHTGDRPYKCVHCGDQFARSDLLSRHVNKCHASEKPPTTTQPARRKGHAQPGSSSAGVRGPAPPLILPPGPRKICDVCSQSRTPAQCDTGLPCGKCLQRNTKCTYVKADAQRLRPIASAVPLFAPPTTVPSMAGLSSAHLPIPSNFNSTVPPYPLRVDALPHQQQFFYSGNQGTPSLPAFNPDHLHSHPYYPGSGTDIRANAGLDAFLDGMYPAGFLYNPAADLMGEQQHHM